MITKDELEERGFIFTEAEEYNEELYGDEKHIVDYKTNTLFQRYVSKIEMASYEMVFCGWYYDFCIKAVWMEDAVLIARIETLKELDVIIKIITKEFPKAPLYKSILNISSN